MSRRDPLSRFVIAGLLLGIVLPGSAVAQLTAFTYQGRLKSGGSPANGAFDFQFKLFDAPVAGSQKGSTLSFDGVGADPAPITVTGGLFTVQLDFGNQYPGADRYLEIAVEPHGGGGYTTLSPRQQLTSTPYAVSALSAHPIGPAGGDLSGAYPNPTVAGLQGRPVSPSSPSQGQVLGWNGSAWAPASTGFDLPYSRTLPRPVTLFDITNSQGAGGGGVASFQITDQANPSIALYAATFGTANAAFFTNTGLNNGGDVLVAKDQGSGRAGFFDITAGANGSDTVWARTAGTGRAGLFEIDTTINGVANASPALEGDTNGTGYGVLGRFGAAGGLPPSALTAGVWGDSASANGVMGTSSAVSGIGVYGRESADGGLGVAGTSAAWYGVRGVFGPEPPAFTGIPTAGVWGYSSLGAGVLAMSTATTPGADGVYASSLGTSRFVASVHAIGNGAAGAGAPKAAALTIENGAINVAGAALANRAAGTIPVAGPWFPIVACQNEPSCFDADSGLLECTHTHPIGWWNSVTLFNNLILGGPTINADHSIILATVETDVPPPQTSYCVQVHSVSAGSCVLRVARMGTPDPGRCPAPTERVWVHYQIINPLP